MVHTLMSRQWIAFLVLVSFPAVAEEWREGVITVHAVDRAGAPVPEAHVVWARGDQSLDNAQPPESAITDAQGNVSLAGLNEGSYILHLTAADIGAWAAASISKDTPAFDLTLPLDVYQTLRGTVEDTAGTPLADARIFVNGTLLHQRTDASGAFRVPHLASNVEESSPALTTAEVVVTREGCGLVRHSFRPMAEPVRIVMKRGGRLRALVHPVPPVDTNISFFGEDPDYFGVYQPLPKAGETVSPWLPAGARVDVGLSTWTDSGVWSGHTTAVVPEGETLEVPLELTYKTREEVEAEREAYEANRPHIRGRVVTWNKEAPVRASIFIDYAGFNVEEPDLGTGEDGRFVSHGLSEGQYSVTALPVDKTLYCLNGSVQVLCQQGEDSEDLLFLIDQGCAIRGRVVSADGEGVPETYVYFRPTNPSENRFYVRTTRSGNFSIPNLAFPDQAYTLTVQYGSGEQVEATVPPIGKGRTSPKVEIRLPNLYLGDSSRITLDGIVLDRSGAPVPQARVSLGGDVTSGVAETDEGGHFQLITGGSGTARVAVTLSNAVRIGDLENSGFGDRECVIIEGGEVELSGGKAITGHRVVVEVPQLRVVAGQVHDSDGVLMDAEYRCYFHDGESGMHQVEDGQFVRSGLPESVIVLEFLKQGYQPRVLVSGRDFEVGDMDIDVTLKPGPFSEGDSIWKAVTEYPDGAPGPDAMPRYEQLSGRLQEWRSIAAGESGRSRNHDER
ncbi:MAG: carboxypeptidase regulatory-like domain-containing protein [Candidatus Hydrogenedentes bacterium]|nr:carboxypeptidase regulatory-like domain-containing protein [Candidatus Hydrogenedentota bacterium]